MTELNGRTKLKQTGLQFEATLTNVTLLYSNVCSFDLISL